MPNRKVIFLDRDGTINVDHGYVHRLADWELCPHAPAALAKLQADGFLLTVTTNQSGIGHGLYTEQEMNLVNAHMRAELLKQGVTIDAIAFCPHHREAKCICRKPATGMVSQITKQLGKIDLPNSWSIGDKPLDVEFGRNAGARTALIRSRYWQEKDLLTKPDMIVDSLLAAADNIIKNRNL